MKTVTRIETEERKRHVLVVDDEMINRLLLGHILQNEFEIHYAADGEQALAFVEKEYETLSIILLDLLMPKVDGFQVLEKLCVVQYGVIYCICCRRLHCLLG